MPIIRRADLDCWAVGTVGALRAALGEVPDRFEVMVNQLGNLALCEPGDDEHPRRYAGYVDLVTGEVAVSATARPGDPREVPWIGDGAVAYRIVDRSDAETNRPGNEPAGIGYDGPGR
jgi:hypothetical protein